MCVYPVQCTSTKLVSEKYNREAGELGDQLGSTCVASMTEQRPYCDVLPVVLMAPCTSALACSSFVARDSDNAENFRIGLQA